MTSCLKLLGTQTGVKQPDWLAVAFTAEREDETFMVKPLLPQLLFFLIRVWAGEASSTPEASWEGGGLHQIADQSGFG